MTEDEARASADLADRVAQSWGERPDEFHIRAVAFVGESEPNRYGLAKTFGGEIVEWAEAKQLVTAFTNERRENFYHASMVRKVSQ